MTAVRSVAPASAPAVIELLHPSPTIRCEPPSVSPTRFADPGH
jgi:hypothetical protein